MRFTELEIQTEDIMWFAVDECNHIFVCTSGGCGVIPEFVCRSREEAELLEEYFLTELVESTQESHVIQFEKTNSLIEDFRLLSRKGIFCFDVSMTPNCYSRRYIKYIEPVLPIRLECLPERIQEIMADHRIPVDVSQSPYIDLKNDNI